MYVAADKAMLARTRRRPEVSQPEVEVDVGPQPLIHVTARWLRKAFDVPREAIEGRKVMRQTDMWEAVETETARWR